MDAMNTPPAAASPRSRRVPARKAPPGRRDSRRPEVTRPETRRPELRRPRPGAGSPAAARPAASPSASALRAAAARERERQPPFWFASRLVLVLSGQRPVHTLLGHTRSSAYEQLAGLASGAPLRPRGADRRSPAVLDARGSRPSDGVIEAFARIVTGDRQRAMAFRLELCSDRRWRCAAVELDGQSPSDRSRPQHLQRPERPKPERPGPHRPRPGSREP
ncbi:Rv3235 family protein [Streptomyces sp. HNM0575]|uniref:Rv3235 family protein n=1 Tax=Streptomyces sp. HNM0575 TaxID=2716338 RepID=UPI001F10CF51|nr:Rv3235 family protein [Streptomyces sp. HNM0575]